MNIRFMLVDDIQRIMAIASDLPEAPEWPRNAYVQALDPGRTPERIALVAEQTVSEPWEGEILGFLITVLIPPEAELETIAVARNAQRQGIGTRLQDELLNLLKKRQLTKVVLEVRESNLAARAFYHAAGWMEIGRRSGYYADPKEDAILLSRSIL